MAGHRLRIGAWIALAFAVVISSLAFANNPDGSHPVWEGPFGEQIDMYTGELSYSVTDVSISTRGGIPLAFTRSYSSELFQVEPTDTFSDFSCSGLGGVDRSFKPFGWGWSIPVVRITDDMIFYADGQYEPFFKDAKNRKRTRSFAVLNSYGESDTLALRYPDGTIWIFGDSVAFGGAPHLNGRYLKRVTDHTTKNYVDYTYANSSGESAGGLLVRMQDQSGRYIKVYYNSLVDIHAAVIDSVEYRGDGGAIRMVRYTYDNGLLVSVGYPDGRTISYEYTDEMYCGQNLLPVPGSASLLSSVTIPTGGKVKYTFERYSEVLVDPLDTIDATKYLSHYAVRNIDIDSNGVAYNYASFYRDPTAGYEDNSVSQVKVVCDSCASGDREVYSWEFTPKWINHDLSSESHNMYRYEKYGVPFEFYHFKAPASCYSLCYPDDYYSQSYFANYRALVKSCVKRFSSSVFFGC